MDYERYRQIRQIFHGLEEQGLYEADQSEIFEMLIQRVGRVAATDTVHQSFINIVHALVAGAKNNEDILDVERDGVLALIGTMPSKNAPSEERDQFVIDVIAAILAEAGSHEVVLFSHASPDLGFLLTKAMAQYISYQSLDRTLAERLNATFEEAKRTEAELQAQLETMRNWSKLIGDEVIRRQQSSEDLRAQIAQGLETVSNLDSRVQDSIKRVSGHNETMEALAKQADDSNRSILAKVDAVAESAIQNAGRKMWDERARASTKGFWVTGAALILLLALAPGAALLNYESILHLLSKINAIIAGDLGPNANTAQVTMAALSRLIIVAAPLVLYFWMVRIIVRLNMHSLAMAEDASQRRTIMDTYTHMVEQQIVQKEDRALLLNAIFRPPPGQVNDSVEPPNFAELLEKMK